MRAWLESLRGTQRSQKWAQRAKIERQRQCLEALSLLQRYIDGELDTSEAAAFERHLDSCPACAREMGVYLDIKDGLADRRGEVDRAASARLRNFARGLRNDL